MRWILCLLTNVKNGFDKNILLLGNIFYFEFVKYKLFYHILKVLSALCWK